MKKSLANNRPDQNSLEKGAAKEKKLFEVKTNLPKKHPPPQSLKIFLNAVKSEIEDPMNRYKVRPNLPPDEFQGLKDLVMLQKERIITIKPCDKGAGVIVLHFVAYLNSCYKHLSLEKNKKMAALGNIMQK